MTNASTLANYLFAAATQRRLMQPWLQDKRFVEKGGKILHAVDTDIVVLYTAPEDLSIKAKRRKGYTEIFPEDGENLAIVLGRAIAEHIFYNLTGKGFPLLVIPPIEEEIRIVYTAVARMAEKEKKKLMMMCNC